MNTFKIPIHSIVDLITNSSTEFYTDFSNSLRPCKDVINEFLKIFDIDKTCDDIFEVSLENEDEECSPARLIITAKEEKYESLGQKFVNFLESGEAKEFYN